MKVLLVSAEVFPYAKTGGLADVSAGLAAALMALGHEVAVLTPMHRVTRQMPSQFSPAGPAFRVESAGGGKTARILVDPAAPVPTYFVENDEYFDRPGLYGEEGHDYGDSVERWGFFCRVALRACQGISFRPDVIHCSDWHTALIPAYVRCDSGLRAALGGAATVLTIHNLAYQGIFPASHFSATCLPATFFTVDGCEYYGSVNLLKAGIVAADKLVTVSPTYAAEILTPENGCGLDPLLRGRRHDLCGILNGVDTARWNPGTDGEISRSYGLGDPEGKYFCKRSLLAELEVDDGGGAPLLAFVARLVEQKGLDILLAALPQLLDLGVRLVVHGEGERRYREALARLCRENHHVLAFRAPYDEGFAHRVLAGADMLLMPSRFEPCGLSPIYGLRYGSIPVVRATGGLKDAVRPYGPASPDGTGFTFTDYSPGALVEAVRQAMEVFLEKQQWQGIMRNAMSEDLSWIRPAGSYVAVYENARAEVASRMDGSG